MGAGKGSTANDTARDQETHLARFVENPEVHRSKAPQGSAPAAPTSTNPLPVPELREKRTVASPGESGAVPADDTL